MPSVPTVKLNDGTEIPILGLGTYEAPKGETKKIVSLALQAGYRHLDCADFYENEDEVGEALAEAFASGLVTRNDVYITTKVWPNWHAKGRPTLSAKRSLKNLGLDYVDLLLIHWPTPLKQDDDHFYPVDENNQAIQEMVKKAETTAVENGLFENARENAEMMIKGFIYQNFDSQEYQISFTYEKGETAQ